MDFVKPKLKIILKKLESNNRLIKFLTDIGGLITIDDFYEAYGYKTKKDPKIYVKTYNNNVLKRLANLFLDNEKEIEENSINTLINKSFLFNDIKLILGLNEEIDISNSVYREIYFCYKNSYADNFFQNNWKQFLPDVDSEEIDKNEIAEALMSSFAIQFDKIDEIISDSFKFKSYEDIPEEYINYLSQLLGIEQKTFMLEKNQINEFRVLAANIIEIYKQKGEFGSFELMFNLFGYGIDISMFYFDRRRYFSSNEQNTETDTSDKNNYRYYLTKNNPSLNIAEYFDPIEIVSDKDMTQRYNLEEFDILVEKYGLECVLGIDEYYFPTIGKDNKNNIIYDKTKSYKYTGNVYKYFKTNYVKIAPRPYGTNANFKTKQLYVINALLDFLTPYFWKKQVVVNILNGDSKDSESITVNGHRDDLYDEGFRLLDSENWAYIDETEYEDASRKQLEDFKLTTLKRDLLLTTPDGKEYVILHNNDYVITKEQYKKVKNKNNFLELRTMLGKTVYISKFLNKNGLATKKSPVDSNDNISVRNTYYNSLGEKKGDRKIDEKDFNVLMEPISRKIKTINSTKYWGKVKEDNNLPVYPIWSAEYIPADVYNPTNPSNPWFTPAVINEKSHLYIPKHNVHDTLNEWFNTKEVGLSGLEGITLKKYFLENEEKREIKWVLPENETLFEFLTKKENADFFKTETKKVQNNTWNRLEYNVVENITTNNELIIKKYPVIILKDNQTLLDKEEELKNILNMYNIKYTNIYNIKENDLLNISFKEDYDKACTCLDYVKNGKNHTTLNEFVKKYKVVNYDYINEKILCSNISEASFEESNNFFRYKNNELGNIFSSILTYNSLFLQKRDDSSFYVYKYCMKKNSPYNRYSFRKINTDLQPKYKITNIESLKEVRNYNDLSENLRLYVDETSGKTYFCSGSGDINELFNGTIISVNDEKYIAEMITTNKKTIVPGLSETLELKVSSEYPQNFGEFSYDGKNMWQRVYSNIKQGDLIYSPKEDKIYEILFNGAFGCTVGKKNLKKKSETIIKDNDTYIRNYIYNNTEDCNSIFGIKEVVLTGTLKFEKGKYFIISHDYRYRGVSEQDDNDNYIFNNNDREVSWNVLNGCDTNYLSSGKIKRPTKIETDKVFEKALISKTKKNNNRQIVENILTEFLGSKNFFQEIELTKKGK